MIATRSHTRSTSVSRCELRKTVEPASRTRAGRWSGRRHAPTGSRAEVGSSRTTSAGAPSSATASPRRCCMPFEKRADGVVGPVGQADVAQRRVDRRPATPVRRRRPRDEPGVQLEHLPGAQPGLVAEQLGQVADPRRVAPIAERRPEHGARAAGRAGQAEQQLDRGRLARAVGPEEAEDLARARRAWSGRSGPRCARSAWPGRAVSMITARDAGLGGERARPRSRARSRRAGR